jgi:hypothetical protein
VLDDLEPGRDTIGVLVPDPVEELTQVSMFPGQHVHGAVRHYW